MLTVSRSSFAPYKQVYVDFLSALVNPNSKNVEDMW
jgi:hypothetical protein